MTSLRDVDAIDEANRCNTSFCTSTTMDLQSSCDDIMIIVIAYRVIVVDRFAIYVELNGFINNVVIVSIIIIIIIIIWLLLPTLMLY